MLKKAYELALKTLKDQYTNDGIFAGKSHFSDIWLRDSCFASFGSLTVGDKDIVKTNIKTVLSHLHENGQVPLRVGQKWILLKFLGFDAKIPQPRFMEDKGVSTPTDGNSLLIIVAQKYFEQSDDRTFFTENFETFKKIMDWNFTQDFNNDLLMEEGPFAGWADSLKKKGTVLYTNVLHFSALQAFSRICEALNKPTDARHYLHLANCVKEKINTVFWNGSYFIDWLEGKKKHDFFSTDGNVLAIVFGLTNLQQAKKIQAYIQKFELDSGFSTHTNFPKYGLKHIYKWFIPIRIHDYHNGLEWLWIGCVDAVAKSSIGMKKEAIALLERIAKKIVEYEGVYEVYDKGSPVKRLFYKSERWFAWSSGLFVWACNTVGIVSEFQ